MARPRTTASKGQGDKQDPGAVDLESDKLYFKIGEVAEIVGVAPYVLRYWESEFRAVKPQKSRSQQRVYRRRDVETLLRIKHLLYQKKFTIAGARQQLREAPEACEPAAPSGAYLAQQSFRRVRTALDELRAAVEHHEMAPPIAADPALFLRRAEADDLAAGQAPSSGPAPQRCASRPPR